MLRPEIMLRMSHNGDGSLAFHLYTNRPNAQQLRADLKDTARGFEVFEAVTGPDGNITKVMTDMTDRAAVPVDLLLELINKFARTFQINGQALLNRARLERLKAEGVPINARSMCMCGSHMAPEFEQVPFQGNIVGVEHYAPTEQVEKPVELGETLDADIRAILGKIDEGLEKDGEASTGTDS